jgi:Site-specific recombinases, DNA invertase Pin homologs
MNAVIYARYSTDNQNSDTIEVQVEKCSEYANEHNMNVTDIFADEATSGMKSVRKELSRFFSCANDHEFDCVLIYDQSRFSRDIVDWFTFRRAIQNNDIKLVSVTQSFVGGDLNDPAVFATEGINALVNQLHVLTTRQKVVEKMNFMAKQGLHTGGRPLLGYDVVDKKYAINEYEAEIIRELFKMYAEGKSYREIIEIVNNKGYKTKNGRPFGTNSLNNLFHNERYIGTYVYNKIPPSKNGKRNSHAINPDAIRIENAVPKIIDDDTWAIVQKRLDSHKQNAKNKAKVEYLLSGKIYCGKCGMSMVGDNSKGKYFYYICSGKSRLKNCDKKPIQKEKVENLVIAFVKDMLSSAEKREVIAKELHEYLQRNNSHKNFLRSRLNEIEGNLMNINKAIMQGIYSKSTAKTLETLESEQQEIQVQLSNLPRVKSYEEILTGLECFSNFGDKTIEEKKKLLLMVSRVYVFDNEIQIFTNPMNEADITPLPDTEGAAPPAPKSSSALMGWAAFSR